MIHDLTPALVRSYLKAQPKKATKRARAQFVSLLGNKTMTQFCFSTSVLSAIEGAKQVRVLYDDDKQTLAFFPDISGRGYKVTRSPKSTKTAVSANAIRKVIGLRDTFRGRLPAKLKDGAIIVNLRAAKVGAA